MTSGIQLRSALRGARVRNALGAALLLGHAACVDRWSQHDMRRTDGAVDGGDVAVDAPPDEPPVDAVSSCGVRMTFCGDMGLGSCVDLQRNALHCGACFRRCPTGSNATAECVPNVGSPGNPRCGLECETGWIDCDRDAANGCERRVDAGDCGS